MPSPTLIPIAGGVRPELLSAVLIVAIATSPASRTGFADSQFVKVSYFSWKRVFITLLP